MSKYSLENFSTETLEATRSHWTALVDADAFDIELEPFFGWASNHIVYKDGDSVAFALRNNDTTFVDAIVELVESKGGNMHKMLKVVPSPAFWNLSSMRDDLIGLYVETFFEIVKKVGFKASRKIKIYGRNDEMMSLLRSIHATWAVPESKAEFEGRFLAITWS